MELELSQILYDLANIINHVPPDVTLMLVSRNDGTLVQLP